MKLLACVTLVLVILEEYHCDPCLDWSCGRRRNDNDREENKFRFDLGFTAKATISGQSEHKHETGYKPSYHPHHRYPPYGLNGLGDRPTYNPDYPHHGYSSYRQNGLGHIPNYQPHYSPSKFPSYRIPYSRRSGRTFGATYNIPYGRQGGASKGTPQRTPYHRGSYGPQYHRPRYGTPYPTPFGMAHQTPNGAPIAPNGSSSGAPNGSPSSAPNGSPSSAPNGSTNSTPSTPAQTPVESGDGTPQRKQLFVTPNGIQETPAQPLDNAS